jgi:hypothetical protein
MRWEKKKKKKSPLPSIHTYRIKEKECSDAIKDTIKKKKKYFFEIPVKTSFHCPNEQC